MPSGARRVVVGTAVLAALATPATATAQEPTLPLEVRGVTAVNGSGGAVRIVFSDAADRLYRRVAGRMLIVRCERIDRSGPLLLREERASELETTITAPRQRRPACWARASSST